MDVAAEQAAVATLGHSSMTAPLLESSKEEAPTENSNIIMSMPPEKPSKALEQVFLTMHYRKMQRDLNGPQKKKTKYHFIALLILLVIIYGAGAYSNQDNDETLAIVLTLGQMALIGTWIFVTIVISSIFAGSKFVVLLYWLFIYWPLLAILATVIFHGQTDIFGGDQSWIAYSMFIAQSVTILAFLFIYYVYPRFITSKFFLEKYSPTRFWKIRLVEQSVEPSGKTKFVLKYDGIWGCLSKRYYCQYVGEVNNEGLPHGQGIWSDDSYEGEVLTGTWVDGEPTAPYSSRQYGGKGNTFAAVKLAYFMANDDTFEANKLVPSNEEPARCGVASVECSVAGDFMSHLPEASLVGEPQVEGGDGLKIGDCCKQLTSYGSMNDEEKPVTSLQIYSNDARGIQIDGHLFQPTLSPFTRRIKEIVINVTSIAKESGYEEVESDTTTLEETEEGVIGRTSSSSSTSGQNLQLEVRNWTRTHTKAAMIFIPGFNSWLKHSLETFGQMMAMAKMGHVLPILFAWPGAQVLTYRQASVISGSEKNRANFLQMLKGLQAAGIQNIHIVTHSLGVQSLMAAMEDTTDGSPSLVSQCFDPAPLDDEDSALSTRGIGRMQCRSITMLNPDFNVNAFREKGFQSLRRVTSLITVVGDKADQALFWSSLINGITNRLGYSQPSMCDSKARQDETGFHLQQPIGKYIDQMYIEEGLGSNVVVHQHKQSLIATGTERNSRHETDRSKKIWLDCDVIDTTGLDTNVNDLRHSAYNVNSILLRDIEELITTRKRASERTTLLHKKGNIYEYCHAPSFVKM